MLSLCVCLSVHHKPVLYRNDWTNWAGICHGGGVPFTHPTLLYWIWVIPKIRVLFSGTLYQTSDLENFGAASQLHCPQTVVVGGGACWRHLYTVGESWLFTTSPSAVTVRLHYCDLLLICHTICFYNWQDFDWHSADSVLVRSLCITARAHCAVRPPAAAEFLVLLTY